MSKHKIGSVSFGSLEDKQIWILNGIIQSLDYIGKESTLSNTENELRNVLMELQLLHLLQFLKLKRFGSTIESITTFLLWK